jgi:protease-4
MTEEEKKLLQDMIDNVYGQFLKAVVEGREDAIRDHLAETQDRAGGEITPEELAEYVKQFADGRIFSGEQAFEAGLIDALGTFETAIDEVKKLAGIKGEPKLISSRRPKGLLESLTGETRSLLQQVTPGQVSLEYRFALP